MRSSARPFDQPGLVLSDLHLFARRSKAEACLESLRSDFESVTTLVLNGDIIDFQWSILPSHRATISAALEWLAGLLVSLPRCQIHYIQGNHDCITEFRAELIALSLRESRLKYHDQLLCLGSNLFLHGDCADCLMDDRTLQRRREAWNRTPRHGQLRTAAYLWSDRLGLTQLAHRAHFPPVLTVQRIRHYLHHIRPGWHLHTRHCYFGHTHVPLRDFEHDGIVFHNSGSAIENMGFNPIFFEANGGLP